jgi:DNA (cytosine-5)-methyltransferase 1
VAAYFFSMFAGIGGFDLAAYWAGLRFDGYYFSETDKYVSGVFQKRFPKAIALGDVREIDYGKLPEGEWIVAGGPPCQPFSLAGKKLRDGDARNMWPEAIRTVRGIRPRFAVFENVYGVLDYLDGHVLPHIESEGYKTETVCIPARTVGKNHERKRWFIIAYPDKKHGNSRLGIFKEYAKKEVREGDYAERFSPQRSIKAAREIAGKYHGVSGKLGEYETTGNAVVPQCAELIFMLPVFDRWRLSEEG